MLNDLLKKVSVIGAGGKMGSGIALLLLQEMARTEAETLNKVGTGAFSLTLIDTSEQALVNMHLSLRSHLTRFAEQNINQLRKYFQNNGSLVSNEDIIDYFVNGAMEIVRTDTTIEATRDAKLIFEAIVEDIDIKSAVLQKINSEADRKAYFFTNTSSIPIEILNKKAHLNDHLIGFHFYNPPPIQKLLEIIPPANVKPELFQLSKALAVRLKKNIVFSKDVAGFIGNGFFMREMLFAYEKVNALLSKYSQGKAFYIINKVTQEFLIRPMGMFQLVEFVGIDVCRRICTIMELDSSLIQTPIPVDESDKNECDQILGPLPKGHISWKILHKSAEREAKLHPYFSHLLQDHTFGAELAKEFLQKSSQIAHGLVSDGVAQNLNDVETVLKDGFYHLYGPSFYESRREMCPV